MRPWEHIEEEHQNLATSSGKLMADEEISRARNIKGEFNEGKLNSNTELNNEGEER